VYRREVRTYVARPLTREAFAPFGHVLEITPSLGEGTSVNMGTARRHNAVLEVENLRPNAKLNVAAFRCQPSTPGKFPVVEVEKHPHSGQLFVPLNATRYMVAVAHGQDTPDLDTLEVFLAHGRQGVCYGPGIWHQPMIVFDVATDFSCFVWEDGTKEDCIPYMLPHDQIVTVAL
jgi:ureidoglycolate lyase